MLSRAPNILLGCIRYFAVVCFLAVHAFSPILADSLQKGPVYFYDRYGSQQSSRSVVGYKIYTPFKYNQVPIDQPCLIRKYAKDGVTIDVLFSDPGLEALWVRIVLAEKFTNESLNAALNAYGNEWKQVKSNSGLGIEIPLLHVKQVYRSREGRYAFFTPVLKQLFIYSADSVESVQEFVKERETEKAKVPVF